MQEKTFHFILSYLGSIIQQLDENIYKERAGDCTHYYGSYIL